MKKCKRFLQKRILPFVIVFMIVLSTLLVSAPNVGAVVYNYNDYIQSIKVDGDNDLVTVSLPVSGGVSGYTYGTNIELFTKAYYERFYLPDEFLESGTWVRLRTIGTNFVSTKNIPNGTLYRASFGMDMGGILIYNTPTVGAVVDYYDDSFLSSQFNWIGSYPIADFEVTGTLDIPNDAESFRFGVNIENLVVDDNTTEVYFYLDSFQLQMTISSLYRLQQEVGETNEILEAVKVELIAQGTTLDEVLVKLGVIEANQRDILSTLALISTNLWEWFSQTWTKLETGFQSIVDAIGSGVTSGLSTITTKVEQIVTGQSQTNDHLDEIINGGEIVDPGVSDAVDQFDDQMSGVTDFENQVQSDFSQQFDAVLADFDGIGDLGPAFNFLGGYAGTLFVSLQDYSFIIVLPIMIGVFMAICQHFPRGPLRGRSFSERVSFSQSELQSNRDAQSEFVTTRSWVDRDS